MDAKPAEQRGTSVRVGGRWEGGDRGWVEWGSAEVLQTDPASDTKSGLSPDAVNLDVGYGLVTHEGVGLLTTYGGVSPAGPSICGIRPGGHIKLGT